MPQRIIHHQNSLSGHIARLDQPVPETGGQTNIAGTTTLNTLPDNNGSLEL